MSNELQSRMRFADLKAIVKNHEQAVKEWLEALLQIKEEELFKLDKCATFREWVQQNCTLSYDRVRHLLTEHVQRQLITATTGEAIHTGSVAAVAAAASIDESKVEHKKASTKDVVVTDSVGNVLKFEALKNWGRREQVKAVLDGFKGFREQLDHVLDKRDPLWHEINFSMLDARLDELAQVLRAAMPYAVCPECQGAPTTRGQKCALCGNKGLISRTLWQVAVAEEKKQVMAKTSKGQQ